MKFLCRIIVTFSYQGYKFTNEESTNSSLFMVVLDLNVDDMHWGCLAISAFKILWIKKQTA